MTKPTSEPTIQLEDWPDRARPSKRFESKVRTVVKEILFCGCSAWRWQVAGLSATHQDRLVGPVHCLYRARAAGSLSASRDRPDSGVTSKTFVLVIKG